MHAGLFISLDLKLIMGHAARPSRLLFLEEFKFKGAELSGVFYVMAFSLSINNLPLMLQDRPD